MHISENDERNLDEFGRRTDCHFYAVKGKKTTCGALREFYAADKDINDQCRGCVFFKTDDEFEYGMKRGVV